MIKIQEKCIYSGEKLYGKGVFAAELFCFLGQKTDKNTEKTEKEPGETGEHRRKTGENRRKTSENRQTPQRYRTETGKSCKKLPGTGKARAEGRWGSNVLTQHRRAGVF